MQILPRSFLRPLLFITSIVFGLVFTVYAIQWMPRVTHGFAMYYTYAKMLANGDDFSRVYDYDYFNSKVEEYGMDNMLDMPNNIPTNALALFPVTWLQPVPAKIVWSLISLCALAGSLLLMFDLYEVRFSETIGLGMLSLVFLWRPIYDSIALGQVYFVLLFLFSLSMRGIFRSSAPLSGLPLAATFLIKGYGVVPLLWLGFQKRWKPELIALLAAALVVVTTLPLFTVETWTIFYKDVVAKLGTQPTDGHTAFQTINGILLHLFSFDIRWLPSPLVILPMPAIRIMSYGLNALLIVLVLSKRTEPHPPNATLSYAAAIGTGVITAPLAEEYHFVLFLPIVIGLGVRVFRGYLVNKKLQRYDWVFIMAVAVMAAPLPYKSLHLAEFPMILFAYPKLYAGVAIILYYRFWFNPNKTMCTDVEE